MKDEWLAFAIGFVLGACVLFTVLEILAYVLLSG